MWLQSKNGQNEDKMRVFGIWAKYLRVLDLLRVGGCARGLQDAVQLYVRGLDQLWPPSQSEFIAKLINHPRYSFLNLFKNILFLSILISKSLSDFRSDIGQFAPICYVLEKKIEDKEEQTNWITLTYLPRLLSKFGNFVILMAGGLILGRIAGLDGIARRQLRW